MDLLDADEELNFQRNLFEEDKNYLKHFINNETENIVWISVSGTLMATRRSTLRLWKVHVFTEQFGNPLWVHNDNTTPVKQWNFEEFAKWVTAIEGMPDNLDATSAENKTNGAAMLAMKEEKLKSSSESKVRPLTLLLEEISNLRIENKPEARAIFYYYYVYLFEKS